MTQGTWMKQEISITKTDISAYRRHFCHEHGRLYSLERVNLTVRLLQHVYTVTAHPYSYTLFRKKQQQFICLQTWLGVIGMHGTAVDMVDTRQHYLFLQ